MTDGAGPVSHGERRHRYRSREAVMEPEDALLESLKKAQWVPGRADPLRQETSVKTLSSGSSLTAFGEPRPVTGSQFVAVS